MDLSKIVARSWSYREYLLLLEKLVALGKTTGSNQSQKMVDYTLLNIRRMKRLNKTLEIRPELATKLKDTPHRQLWLVLTEGWCGDAAQIVPAFAKMGDLSSNIDLKLISRDEHPELMNAHLTNGSRSIPKLICLNRQLKEIGEWGPRPAPAQQMMLDHKANPVESYDDYQKRMQLWYLKDKTLTLQSEFEQLFDEWKKRSIPS